MQGLGVVGGVSHDGADGCAEPVADIGVGTVGESEGLEGGAAGAYCFGLVGLGRVVGDGGGAYGTRRVLGGRIL